MKNALIFLWTVCLFFSCSKENDTEFLTLQETQSELLSNNHSLNDSVITILTEEDFYEQFSSNGEIPGNIIKQTPIVTKAYTDSRIVKSYHSCEPRPGQGNVKERFSNKELCSKIGIPQGIYITEHCEAKITLYTGEGERLIPTESPNCGFQPDGKGIRGYSASFIGNKIVLTTYLTHIKCDILGRKVDIWYPVKPEELIWNYDIYLPHWN